MANSETVKLNYPVRKDLNAPIEKNLHAVLDHLRSIYNEKQKSYPDKKDTSFPEISQYGYELVSTRAGFRKGDDGKVVINIQFKIKPLSDAFGGDSDGGLSEEACSSLMNDLGRALLLSPLSPFHRGDRTSSAAAEQAILDFFVNNGRSEAIDTSRYSVTLQAHLDKFLKHSNAKPQVSCSIDLAEVAASQL